MERDRLDEIVAIWTRGIGRRPFLQMLASLVLALVAGRPIPPEPTDARKRQKRQRRQKRRKPEGEAKVCRRRCSKKKSRQARRRCHRRCQNDESVRPCDTDRDCAPCARCRPEGCVAICQPDEVCQNDRCTTPGPGPDICPTEGTEALVTSYAEVADDYARGRDLAIPAGPDAVANFVNERFTDLYDQFSSDLQDRISPEFLANFSYQLQHNRVHFEVPSVIGIFDGHLVDDTIEGYFTQIFTLAFSITATDPIEPGSERSLEGRWEGIILDPTGAIYPFPFDIVVTFTRVSGELSGTLDVAGVVENVPITDISVSENRPLSVEPSGEVRIFPEPDWTRYSALVGWGSYALAFTFWFDTQRQVIAIDIVPDWPVPPDPAAGLPVETVTRLPLDGVWYINAGGPRQFENHHVGNPAMRHAYDLVVWNESAIYRPNADENADFWSWNQPIFAPAAGTIVDAVNDLPDNPLGVVDTTTSLGNMIALQTAPHEFLLMGHLRQGSVAVAVGVQVQEGQFLARVGNSGASTGPHLHMQLQDRRDPLDPETVSLPFRFKGLLVNGQPAANPSLVMGDFVQHAGCPTPVPTEFAPQPERDRPKRPERGNQERPTVTQRSAKWLRSPATVPLDSPPPMPWGNR